MLAVIASTSVGSAAVPVGCGKGGGLVLRLKRLGSSAWICCLAAISGGPCKTLRACASSLSCKCFMMLVMSCLSRCAWSCCCWCCVLRRSRLAEFFVGVEELFELRGVDHLYAGADCLGVRGMSLLSAACSESLCVVESHAWYGQK